MSKILSAMEFKERKPLIVVELAIALQAVLSGDDEEQSFDYGENVLERFREKYGDVPKLNENFS